MRTGRRAIAVRSSFVIAVFLLSIAMKVAPWGVGIVILGMTTNTVADYTALAEGLEMALEKGVGEVAVNVDSPVIAGHLLNEYRVRADHLRPLVEQVRQLLDRFSSWSLTPVSRDLNRESSLLANRELAPHRQMERT